MSIVWNLAATIAYKDGSWLPVELRLDDGGYFEDGPDISQLPEITQFISSLGLTPKATVIDNTVADLVFRFTLIMTNGDIHVLGDTEESTLTTDNLAAISAELAVEPYFSNYFVNNGVLACNLYGVSLQAFYKLASAGGGLSPQFMMSLDDTDFEAAAGINEIVFHVTRRSGRTIAEMIATDTLRTETIDLTDTVVDGKWITSVGVLLGVVMCDSDGNLYFFTGETELLGTLPMPVYGMAVHGDTYSTLEDFYAVASKTLYKITSDDWTTFELNEVVQLSSSVDLDSVVGLVIVGDSFYTILIDTSGNRYIGSINITTGYCTNLGEIDSAFYALSSDAPQEF
jgi:hypothetical protein